MSIGNNFTGCFVAFDFFGPVFRISNHGPAVEKKRLTLCSVKALFNDELALVVRQLAIFPR